MKKSKLVAVLLVVVMVFSVSPVYAEETLTDKAVSLVTEYGGTALDVGKGVVDAVDAYQTDGVLGVASSAAKTGTKVYVGKVIATSAVPTAVSVASATGMTASTGTAIASLSGIAATNATLYAVGAPVATTLATVTGITIAPAVVGGALVAGAAVAVGYGVNCFIDWLWE